MKNLLLSFSLLLSILSPLSAEVRLSQDISPEEKSFIAERKEKAKETLKNLLSINDQTYTEFPTIAFVASGGGLRAATGTLGALLGLEAINLLDAVSYTFGLSGSTWSIFPWVASGKNIFDYYSFYEKNLAEGIIHPRYASKLNFVWNLRHVFSGAEYIQLYGDMLANVLMDSEDGISTTMSSLKPILATSNFPLPIGTAIETSDPHHRIMFEFSPLEAGSTHLNSFVPIEEFGSTFKNGKITKGSTHYEKSLGYYLGLFGAAFSFRLSELVQMISSNKSLSSIANILSNRQFKPGTIPNINLNIPHAPRSTLTNLKLSDAGHGEVGRDGLNTNLPFSSVLRPERKVDIIIVYDSSASLKNAPALRAAFHEAFENYQRIPYVKAEEFNKIDTQDISVLQDTLCPSNGPTIIYIQGRLIQGKAPKVLVDGSFLDSKEKMAKMHNPAQELYPSEKFTYSKEDIQDLATLGFHKIVRHKNAILQVIRQWIKRNKNRAL